ncbi:MAG TPA: ABC transporter permease [Candidatus Acidoferrales bacterium]|jgi:putative ABC transport system permease protein|nr:ABC transporter permease [Candidatus Acidoferrales bacterium]
MTPSRASSRRGLVPLRPDRDWIQYVSDLSLGLQNLTQHKLRSLLTMLGMIFGVAAVVSMLSIGAGAQQQVMAFIEQLGLRNVVVEAKEPANYQELQKIRKSSQGLNFQDYRVIRANVAGLTGSSPRRRFIPSKLIPKPSREMPVLYGVEPAYENIANLRVVAGRFFTDDENLKGAPVCVLGQGAASNLFGSQEAVGQFVKANNQWYRVIGVAGPQLTAQTPVAGLPPQDLNNLIYVPLYATIGRMEDSNSFLRNEIDGVYLQVSTPDASVETADVVRGLLNASHRGADDFSVVVPAELLAEQKRTQRIFDVVMVAIASISLLVGGIGIMNIMLASILERTREIGVRRAVGARQMDIIRQFLIEAVMISFVGGLMGILVGFGMSQLIAWLAGWTTIVTGISILLAFVVSVSVGLIFGIYPARKAARLDPVEAIRYE